ncbi:MAG: GDSL-type esterase/lipase family protein [Candidatus Eisenbacteria bacterium]|nr:GDSL-type esterase/lipase family protein [Candidatus Eisenbacteria bacterium]
MNRPVWQKLVMVTGGILVGIMASEAALRLAGFSYQFNLRAVGFIDDLKPVNIMDPLLLWVREDYHLVLDSLRRERPALVSLGCSCTYSGQYQRRFEGLVRERTGREIVYGNVATIGWSSHQGMAQLRQDVWRLRPRIITALFGWNDHWRGWGIEDKRVSAYNRTFYRYRQVRLMQLFAKGWVASLNRDARSLRVSPEVFRLNLTQMVDFSVERGIVPVLMTAPTPVWDGDGDTDPGSPGTTATQDDTRGDWLPVHRQYVSIVREVAAARGAHLCDLAASFDSLPASRVSELFPWDDIHFNTQQGRGGACGRHSLPHPSGGDTA